jgi:hypothetical protein
MPSPSPMTRRSSRSSGKTCAISARIYLRGQ